MRKRRLAFAMLVSATCLGAIAVACGLDVSGLAQPSPLPDRAEDTGLEASLPKNDATPSPEDGGADADADVVVPRCSVVLPGPTMVEAADGGFCIDSTEVTNQQYTDFLNATAGGTDASFLDASRFDGGLPAFCFPSNGFAPETTDGASPGGPTDPVTFVNWCDAFAFCQYAGKHLCTGGPIGGDAGEAEWRIACTRNGSRKYPYGNTFDGSACNVARTAQAPVGTFSGCNGGYEGTFDMLGNVEEWVDSCSNIACATFGGYYQSSTLASCDTSAAYAPTLNAFGLGFRCCR